MNIASKLTVFFENPFWVGIFERTYDGSYEVSKIVFGSEPKDGEIYQILLRDFRKINFSQTTDTNAFFEKKINPKRLKKDISKELQTSGAGTKAQHALKLQQESKKLERKSLSKELNRLSEDRKFQLRQQRKKEKHKGH